MELKRRIKHLRPRKNGRFGVVHGPTSPSRFVVLCSQGRKTSKYQHPTSQEELRRKISQPGRRERNIPCRRQRKQRAGRFPPLWIGTVGEQRFSGTSVMHQGQRAVTSGFPHEGLCLVASGSFLFLSSSSSSSSSSGRAQASDQPAYDNNEMAAAAALQGEAADLTLYGKRMDTNITMCDSKGSCIVVNHETSIKSEGGLGAGVCNRQHQCQRCYFKCPEV